MVGLGVSNVRNVHFCRASIMHVFCDDDAFKLYPHDFSKRSTLITVCQRAQSALIPKHVLYTALAHLLVEL